MRTLELNQQELVVGGDGFGDFAGGLSCGILVGGILTLNALAVFGGGIGCINYLR